MSRPVFSIQHLTTATQFPEEPVRGRAYFIDDEGIIKINHGQGTITYGNRPGPRGPSGQPLPELFGEMEELSLAVTELASLCNWLNKHYRSKDGQFEGSVELLNEAVAELNSAILSAVHTTEMKIAGIEERTALYDAESRARDEANAEKSEKAISLSGAEREAGDKILQGEIFALNEAVLVMIGQLERIGETLNGIKERITW